MNDKQGFRERLFASFSNRYYRAFWSANFFSLLGNWLQQTAQGWLVFRMTGSEQVLGMVGFMAQLPLIVFGLFAGVLADRWPRRRALIITQSVAMGQAVLLGALTITGHVQAWHIVALAFVLGLSNTFDLPLRHAFLIDLVGPANLRNAIAVNSMIFNVSRLVGPAVAGLLVATLGEGPCFFLNAVSFGGIIGVLALMRLKSAPKPEQAHEPVLQSLKEGLSVAWNRADMRNPLILLVSCGMIVAPLFVLMPSVAGRLLGGGAKTLGLLFSSIGAGSLLGAVFLAAGRSESLARDIGLSGILYALSLVVIGFSHSVYLTCAGAFLCGLGVINISVGTNTLLQSGVSTELRGRMASLYMLAYFGLAPVGSLLLGFIAERYGIANALFISGGWALLAGLWYIAKMPGQARARKPQQTVAPEDI